MEEYREEEEGGGGLAKGGVEGGLEGDYGVDGLGVGGSGKERSRGVVGHQSV